MHARKGRDHWQRIVNDFEESDLSHAGFCESRRLNIGTFRAWLYRLRHVAKSRAAAVELVPVSVRRDTVRSEPTAPLVVILGDLELAVTPGTNVAYVAALVAELRRC